MMDKIDFKTSLKPLYAPSAKDFSLVEVPAMQFVAMDGEGDPNVAADYQAGINWLYSVSYALKFASKSRLGTDYVVPPLEALWWSDDIADFTKGRKDRWKWTQLIMVPDFIDRAMFEEAVEATRRKLDAPPPSLRLMRFEEGLSAQILHVGPYSAEAPTIARLHEDFLPRNGLAENGHHHEIYLSDPRRVPPDRLSTIIRQPVRRI